MGQLCSRPRTVEDKHPSGAETEGVRVDAESGHRQHATLHSHNLHSEVFQHVLPESQGSDAELSELDVVVQQLRNNQNSVPGSAPQLLQQWDHDHRVMLESIDASIQVQACSLAKLNFPCCICEASPALWLCRGHSTIITGKELAAQSSQCPITFHLFTCTVPHQCQTASWAMLCNLLRRLYSTVSQQHFPYSRSLCSFKPSRPMQVAQALCQSPLPLMSS